MRKRIMIGLIIITILMGIFVAIFFVCRNNDEPTYPTPTIEPSSVQSPEPTDQSIEGENKRPEWPVELDPARFDMPLEEWIEQNRVIPDPLPEFVLGSIECIDDETAQGMLQSGFVPSFRHVYYWSRIDLGRLVGENELQSWIDSQLWRGYYGNWWPQEPPEMIDVSFIKHFRISREVFEQGLAWRRFMDEEFNNNNSLEGFELPNADIIYTFDNDIINEFYRRR